MRKAILAILLAFAPVACFAQNGGFNQNASAASGIAFVAAVPGTCTPGVTASVQLSVAPYTVNYCSATNTWTPLSSSLSGTTFPVTVGGTVNSGGIPCFNSATNEQSSAAIGAGVLIGGGGAGACAASTLATDNGTSLIYTGTGGFVGISLTAPAASDLTLSATGAGNHYVRIVGANNAGMVAPAGVIGSYAGITFSNFAIGKFGFNSRSLNVIDISDDAGTITAEIQGNAVASPGPLMRLASNGLWGFSSGAANTTAQDTAYSRCSANVHCFGNGSAVGDFSGTVKASGYNAAGSAGISTSALCSATFTATDGIVTACTAVSDRRLKTNIRQFSPGLAAILQLHPVLYRWNAAGQKISGQGPTVQRAGFIAQDVQKAIPAAVGTERHDGVDYLTVEDRPIIAALVNAIQEQEKKIEALEGELTTLKHTKEAPDAKVAVYSRSGHRTH